MSDIRIPPPTIKDAFWFSPPEPWPDIPEELTAEVLGRLYAESYPPVESETWAEEEVTWMWTLMYHLSHEQPLLALECIVSALRHSLTIHQLGCVAAGALEDIIADHGPVVIDRIEALARRSARFRFALSGVWPRGQDKAGEIWQRVQGAIEPGPRMDGGHPLPRPDL